MTREEIAKWLESLKSDIGKSENQPLWHYAEALDMAIEALKGRPKGHWIRKTVDNGWHADWVCSECGYRSYFDYMDFVYCPKCGADMRGESNDDK